MYISNSQVHFLLHLKKKKIFCSLKDADLTILSGEEKITPIEKFDSINLAKKS